MKSKAHTLVRIHKHSLNAWNVVCDQNPDILKKVSLHFQDCIPKNSSRTPSTYSLTAMSYVSNTSTIEENFGLLQNSSHEDKSSSYECRIKSHFEAAANPGHSTTFRIIAISWFSFCFIVGCTANVTVIKTFVQKKSVSYSFYFLIW